MARAGMTGWRGRHTAGGEGGDDVAKSLELLDQVLSEFDDLENGNVGCVGATVVPEPESPSLGHQSEDDGYMSMNGRRAKLALGGFRPPVSDEAVAELPPLPDPPAGSPPAEMADFPPPPEEAQRLIANLLPRVTPAVSLGSPHSRCKPSVTSVGFNSEPLHNGEGKGAATQTTLPKTRHQRPFGWRNGSHSPHGPHQFKFGSLPYEGALHNNRYPPPWIRSGPLPPRTLATALDRHREVRRQRTGDEPRATPPPPPQDDDPAAFSEDSLEGETPDGTSLLLEDVIRPPSRRESSNSESPLPSGHRGSIAWEVPLDDALMAPGSTKVVGRRRRHSNERSSNGSLNRLKDGDDWPEPPQSAEDENASAGSDQDGPLPAALPLDLTFNGTYVIRKGRRRERAAVPKTSPHQTTKKQTSAAMRIPRQSSLDSRIERKQTDLKRTSSTFDNIRQLLREGAIEGLDEPPPDFAPPTPPTLVRVVSLPSLPSEEVVVLERSTERTDRNSRSSDRYSQLNELVEEAEDELSSLDNPSLNILPDIKDEAIGGDAQGPKNKAREVETQTDLSDIETQSELELVGKQIREISKTKSELEEVEKKIQEIVKMKTTLEREREESGSLGDPWVRAADLPPPDFPVQVQVHEFGPLPPSPVDEFNADLYHPSSQPVRRKADTLPEPFYRCQDPGSDPSGQYLNRPPEPPPHRSPDPVISSSLKTRSMDAGFSRGPKPFCNGSRRENGSERRTLPSELPGPASRRRTLQKRSSTSPQDGLQTCSLPETPIFTRGCDIPRTPHRQTPEVGGSFRPGSSAGINTVTCTGYRGTNTSSSTAGTAYRSGTVGSTLAGAEILRLAGGPARGWYPRHRHPRPASSEHLDRLPSHPPPAWDTARKPMTLPPNITPKFFHRSPRDALRRVTSLLIRGKGSSSKDSKKEVVNSATMPIGDPVEGPRHKRGFLRSFWKRSRHYSLDQQ